MYNNLKQICLQTSAIVLSYICVSVLHVLVQVRA